MVKSFKSDHFGALNGRGTSWGLCHAPSGRSHLSTSWGLGHAPSGCGHQSTSWGLDHTPFPCAGLAAVEWASAPPDWVARRPLISSGVFSFSNYYFELSVIGSVPWLVCVFPSVSVVFKPSKSLPHLTVSAWVCFPTDWASLPRSATQLWKALALCVPPKGLSSCSCVDSLFLSLSLEIRRTPVSLSGSGVYLSGHCT